MKTIIYEICRWAAAAAAVIFILSAADNPTAVSGVSPETLMKAVCDSADMTNMQPAGNQMVKRLYGIDPSDYDFCRLYSPGTNMDVDELLLIKLSDRSQEQSLLDAVESRLDGQKKAFESYGVEQMELLGNHSFAESRAGFFLFVINSKDENIRSAFLNTLEED